MSRRPVPSFGGRAADLKVRPEPGAGEQLPLVRAIPPLCSSLSSFPSACSALSSSRHSADPNFSFSPYPCHTISLHLISLYHLLSLLLLISLLFLFSRTSTFSLIISFLTYYIKPSSSTLYSIFTLSNLHSSYSYSSLLIFLISFLSILSYISFLLTPILLITFSFILSTSFSISSFSSSIYNNFYLLNLPII